MFDALYISEDLTCSFFALNTGGLPGEPSDALGICQSSELIDWIATVHQTKSIFRWSEVDLEVSDTLCQVTKGNKYCSMCEKGS